MSDESWKQPYTPPPPMFMGEKEKELVKQVNDELIQDVVGQTVIYYPISIEHTHFHDLYGEAMEKSFLPPIKINALVEWEGSDTTITNFGIDRMSAITVHFFKRTLLEDQDVAVKEGDFVRYGELYYEIVNLSEPRELFGQSTNKVEVSAKCIRAREGTFDGT